MTILTYEQRTEADQSWNEQLRLDMAISSLQELVDQNGVAAVQDWLDAIALAQKPSTGFYQFSEYEEF